MLFRLNPFAQYAFLDSLATNFHCVITAVRKCEFDYTLSIAFENNTVEPQVFFYQEGELERGEGFWLMDKENSLIDTKEIFDDLGNDLKTKRDYQPSSVRDSRRMTFRKWKYKIIRSNRSMMFELPVTIGRNFVEVGEFAWRFERDADVYLIFQFARLASNKLRIRDFQSR